jgi:hypothetical protein
LADCVGMKTFAASVRKSHSLSRGIPPFTAGFLNYLVIGQALLRIDESRWAEFCRPPPQPVRADKPYKTPPLAWGFFVSTALSRVARASHLETHSRASDSEKVSPTVTCPYPGRSLPMHGRPSSLQARRNR